MDGLIEEWRPIEGYEDLYMISNLGNVKIIKNNKIRKLQQKNNGYLQLILNKNSVQKHHYVHRLVAQAFIPNPENLPCVNHIDHDRTNNRVDNLEWCTYDYNNIHSINPGLKEKIILKYDLEGNFIEEFNSPREAANSCNKVRASDILRVCRGERTKAYGFIWRFK